MVHFPAPTSPAGPEVQKRDQAQRHSQAREAGQGFAEENERRRAFEVDMRMSLRQSGIPAADAHAFPADQRYAPLLWGPAHSGRFQAFPVRPTA